MKNKTISLYLSIILSLFSLFSCTKNNDVDVLKQRIDGLIQVIEKRDEQGIKDYLSNDFTASNKLNKPQFFLFIRYHFKNNKSVLVTVLDKEITLNDKYADVTANVLFLGTNEWIPERGQIYKVASRWIKVKGDWVMSRLRWEKEYK